MPFHRRTPAHWLLGGMLTLALSACQSPGPALFEPYDANQVMCTTGAGESTDTTNAMATRVWRGDAPSLTGYGAAQICRRFTEISESLSPQGVTLRFALTGPVTVRSDLERADNTLMRAWPSRADELHVVVVDAIAQCGRTSGYILGCTPQLGRPVVFVKQHALLQDWAPEWVIWAHELGHAAGLLHPDRQFQDPTFPHRLMTYMPTPDSTELVDAESERLAQLTQTDERDGSGAAIGGAWPHPRPAITAAQIVPFVLASGTHGVPIDALAHMDDTALLTLRVLLIDAGQIPALMAAQVNALVTIAELGGVQAQSYVRAALGPGGSIPGLQLRRYGLWALGRGQLRHPTEQTQAFLQQARSARFWCAQPEPTQSDDCLQLAKAAGQAWEDASLAMRSESSDAPVNFLFDLPQFAAPPSERTGSP